MALFDVMCVIQSDVSCHWNYACFLVCEQHFVNSIDHDAPCRDSPNFAIYCPHRVREHVVVDYF